MSGSSDVGYRVSSPAAEGLCVCAQTPTLASKGVVWTHSRTNTNFLFFLSVTHTCTHACTLAHVHPRTLGLPNRNTQHAVSWTWSLGFAWREARVSTPVFRAVIRGCWDSQAASGSHTCAVKCTERPLMNSVHPAALVGQQKKSVNDSGKLESICKSIQISTSRSSGSSSQLLHTSS